MPQPLYVKDVLGATINNLRAVNTKGWQFVFKSADGTITFGYVYDRENTFTDGATSSEVVPLRVDLILVDDTGFNISEWDTLTLTVNLGYLVGDINIILPQIITSTSPKTYYIDSDGNTYNDADLTQPAGGVLMFSESMTVAESQGNDEWQQTYEEELILDELLTFDLDTMRFDFMDSLFLDEEFSTQIELMDLNLSDSIQLGETIRFVEGTVWNEEASSNDIWTEE